MNTATLEGVACRSRGSSPLGPCDHSEQRLCLKQRYFVYIVGFSPRPANLTVTAATDEVHALTGNNDLDAITHDLSGQVVSGADAEASIDVLRPALTRRHTDL